MNRLIDWISLSEARSAATVGVLVALAAYGSIGATGWRISLAVAGVYVVAWFGGRACWSSGKREAIREMRDVLQDARAVHEHQREILARFQAMSDLINGAGGG